MTELDWANVKAELDHVLWICGGTNAGKTTITRRLGKEFGFQCYHSDDEHSRHIELATEERTPLMWHQQQLVEEGRFSDWFNALNPEEMAQGGIEFGAEVLLMVIDDLMVMPKDTKIVVDLVNANPEVLLRAADAHHLVFLVATDSFQRQTVEDHGNEYARKIGENVYDALRLHNEIFRSEAKSLGLRLIATGGEMTEDEAYAEVCRHFGLGF